MVCAGAGVGGSPARVPPASRRGRALPWRTGSPDRFERGQDHNAREKEEGRSRGGAHPRDLASSYARGEEARGRGRLLLGSSRTDVDRDEELEAPRRSRKLRLTIFDEDGEEGVVAPFPRSGQHDIDGGGGAASGSDRDGAGAWKKTRATLRRTATARRPWWRPGRFEEAGA